MNLQQIQYKKKLLDIFQVAISRMPVKSKKSIETAKYLHRVEPFLV